MRSLEFTVRAGEPALEAPHDGERRLLLEGDLLALRRRSAPPCPTRAPRARAGELSFEALHDGERRLLVEGDLLALWRRWSGRTAEPSEGERRALLSAGRERDRERRPSVSLDEGDEGGEGEWCPTLKKIFVNLR